MAAPWRAPESEAPRPAGSGEIGPDGLQSMGFAYRMPFRQGGQ
jgi:hypothetical protein